MYNTLELLNLIMFANLQLYTRLNVQYINSSLSMHFNTANDSIDGKNILLFLLVFLMIFKYILSRCTFSIASLYN